MSFKLTCDLEPKHVQGPDDWHKSTAQTKQVTADYEWSTTEVVRWAPKSYEIPEPEDAGGA